MISTTVLGPVSLALLVVCMALAYGVIACRRSQLATAGQLRDSMNAEKGAVRQLRLGSHNLRAIAMTLQGHAEHLDAGGVPDTAGIARAATGIFDMADYMHEWAQHAPSPRVLNEETLHLGNALDEAISAVTRATRPGRRTWHVDPDVVAVRLRADRRALRHVLMRALSVSVRGSAHEDSIDIRVERTELDGASRAVQLIIEPQSRPSERGHAAVNGGGPDLRLTLARALMEAHGGKLEIEQGDDLTIRIAFPIERIVNRSDATPERATLTVAKTESDDRLQAACVT